MKARAYSLFLATCGAVTISLGACGDDPPGGPTQPGADSGSPPDGAVDAGNDASDGRDAYTPPATCPPRFTAAHSTFRDWDTEFTLAGLTGQDGYRPSVYDFARDKDGSLLVAGYFRWAGALRVDGLARWRNGAWEPGRTNWNGRDPGSGGFYAVAVGPAGELALAANAGKSGELDEIWVDKGAGLEVVGRYARRVRRLAWIDGKLWVAGGMEFENNGPKRLAIWDGITWIGAPGGDPNGYVFDVVPDAEGHVLVAGQFATIGGISARLIADWDGKVWSAKYQMPTDSFRALTLARDGSGTLHAGGLFTLDEAHRASSSFAKWNGTAWEVVGNGVAKTFGTGVVSHILAHDGALYVTGCFDHVNGGEDAPNRIASDNVAKWNGTAWTSIDDGSKPVSSHWYSPNVCGVEPSPEAIWEMPRHRLVADGTRVLMGGAFGGAGGVPSQSIAAYDGAWQALGTTQEGISGEISQLASSPKSCTVYGLARASHSGGKPLTSPVTRYGETGWVPAAPALPANTRCDRMVVGKDDTIVLACSEQAQPEPVGRVLVLKNGAWTRLVEDRLPEIVDVAYAPDGSLWLVGGDGARGFLARWDGTKLVSPSSESLDGAGLRLAFAPHTDDAGYDVIVGGIFEHVGALAADRIARWNGTTWSALGNGTAGNAVSAIAATKDGIYVTTQKENDAYRILSRWDGKTWIELATPENGIPKPYEGTTHTFTSLLALPDGSLIAAGYVWPETGGRNVFYFDGKKFTSVGGGAAAISVDSIALGADAVYFAGSIAEVGEGAKLRASVGVARIPYESSL
ncbi:hypothetical protein LVJ94_50110 [Pendulispora rubella]|uniref:Uncharacterized protein n=1 Tax=Pendulispora rubella TaxID=2741070 RepID=A0ABZ2L8I9_9BACT